MSGRAALTLCLALGLVLDAQADTRRLALIASSNDGGPDRVLLRYADSDARAIARVLAELGGVAAADQTLLPSVGRDTLLQALEATRARLQALRARGDRVELVFYYSGHSDETGLLLGGERLPFTELRRALDSLPADVRVAIVDACASGMLTRRKGGTHRPPFLVDEASSVRGLAILTSSSGSEASQESDRIRASFFTHYLVSALRGAADRDQDGRVTLSEAYRFTFDETLARTERTQSGAQHPSYDMHLSGTGDLVLTDLRQVAARLVLPPGVGGKVRVRDGEGSLVAELSKPETEPVELGLWQGDYAVVVEQEGAWRVASATVHSGREARLRLEDFERVDSEPTVARGGVVIPGVRTVSAIELALIPWLSTNRLSDRKSINLLSLTLLGGDTTLVYGLGLGLLAHTIDDWLIGLQLSTGFNHVGGRLYGMQLAGGVNHAAAPLASLQVAGGLNIAGQRFYAGQIAAGANLAFGGLDGAQVAAAFNLADGTVNGAQIAAGGANLATAHLNGAQIALVNLGASVYGAQVGLVNLAHEVRGAQIGLVNVAGRMQGAPVGLVNVIGDGRFDVEVLSDDVSLLGAGLRYGSQHAYTLIAVGTQPLAERPRWTTGLGLGARLPLALGFSVSADASSHMVWRGTWSLRGLDLLNRVRVGGAYQLVPSLALHGGLSLNALVSGVPDAPALSYSPLYRSLGDATRVELWPGLYLGLLF